MTPEDITKNYYEFADTLQDFHEIFYCIWNVGEPKLTDEIPTAAIAFNRDSGVPISFLFNPDFLKELSEQEVAFIICHEMLHILLNHGKRVKNLDKENPYEDNVINVAMDIPINESLVRSFGFSKQLPFITKHGACFVDTIFDSKANIPKNETFEFYYNALQNEENLSKQMKSGGMSSIDDHNGLGSMSEDELKDLLNKAVGKEKAEKIVKKLKKQAQEAAKGRGTEDISHILDIVNKDVKKKEKWESILGNVARTKRTVALTDTIQWAIPDRRFNLIDPSFMTPGEYELEDEAQKIDLWLFQDVSGSCIDDAQRFYDAARSIPGSLFNVRFHTFDTRVRRVDLKNGKIKGGGGTRFDIIEDFIINESVNKGKRYPSSVFVITDGAGNSVDPQKPDRWHWFLSYDYKHCIPKKSKIFTLEDFE